MTLAHQTIDLWNHKLPGHQVIGKFGPGKLNNTSSAIDEKIMCYFTNPEYKLEFYVGF